MRVIGIISGTSYDAIDVAAADLQLLDGAVVLEPLGARQVSYDDELRGRIASALPPAQTSFADVCRLDTQLGQAFADAAASAVAELCAGRVDLVVSHGQTMYHWVDENGRARGTLQLGQPAWIAELTGAPVVSDLRSRDVVRGGHGAPLVSIFDVLLLAAGTGSRGALNLGGIANITMVRPGQGALAYDIGPANALIDAATHELFGERYDADGRHASRGSIHRGLLAALMDEPYYRLPAPKSTGKETFHWRYLADFLRQQEAISADDVVATVSELTVKLVGAELRRHGLDEVFVSGGGARNPLLMRRLDEATPPSCQVRSVAELGISPDDKEAYAFALLGFLTMHGLDGTVPSCTGALGPSVLGSITPGAAPLRLPEQSAVSPDRLVITPA